MKIDFEKYFIKKKTSDSSLLIASLKAGSYLASQVVDIYSKYSDEPITFMKDIDESFSDKEIRVRLTESVTGKDVFLFQSPFNPQLPYSINDNLFSFLSAVRAFGEHGANSVTGITSYLVYARQDKPSEFQREPTNSRLVADFMITAGLDRLICLQPHSPQVNGFYASIPLNALSAVPIWAEVFKEFTGRQDTIIVAPDIGAAKSLKHIAKKLQLTMAVSSKFRPTKEKVEITEIVGDFTGKKNALIIDDMISTGGSIFEVSKILKEKKNIENIYVAASHLLGNDPCLERFSALRNTYNLRKIYTTNSIPLSPEMKNQDYIECINLAEMFTIVINRLYYKQSSSIVFEKKENDPSR
jgi:ribose-phosphate pyrophosphokinase